ncbi:MAG: substrate-binding domain-containing protein [Candidatus Avoscillospira sp.]
MNTIEVWIEPGFSTSQWCANLLNGMKRGAKARHLHVSYIPVAQPHHVSDAGVVLAGETHVWFRGMIDFCNANKIRCCVASNTNYKGDALSIVRCDYSQISEHMVKYLCCAGKRRIALVGINQSSPADIVRLEGYLRAVRSLSMDLSLDDVFFTDGNISKVCQDFISAHQNYDAAIISNNFYAVYMLGRLTEAGVCVPDDLYLASFGNTKLSRISKPSITSIADNLGSIGYQSMVCMDTLLRDSNISRLSIVVQADEILGGSTAFFPFPPSTAFRSFDQPEKNISSTDDEAINRVSQLESCLVDADYTDYRLINMLIHEDLTKTELADALYLSEGSVNYRIGKLIRKTQVKNRTELIEILRSYSSFIDFSKLLRT